MERKKIDVPDLADVKAGDLVERLLAESITMPLKVTLVHEGLVHCGPWTFDQETGIEEDPDLGWGRDTMRTGSRLTKILERSEGDGQP